MESGVGSFRAPGAVRQNHDDQRENYLFSVWQAHQGRIGSATESS